MWLSFGYERYSLYRRVLIVMIVSLGRRRLDMWLPCRIIGYRRAVEKDGWERKDVSAMLEPGPKLNCYRIWLSS